MRFREEFSRDSFDPNRLFNGEWKVVPVYPHERFLFPALVSPALALHYWKAAVEAAPSYTPEVERLVVVALNAKSVPLGHAVTSVGTVDSTIFHPREIFRAAIIASASSILVMHNHPSGDPTPSAADLRSTRSLRDAATLLQIPVLDHIIIGDPTTYSFRESGMI